MKVDPVRKSGGSTGLVFRCFVPVLVLAMLAGQSAIAQQSGPLSPSLVLVLKLVSKTHVQPVTGIVVSGNGQVLVPADFVSADEGEEHAEIIVLDGGTDIVRHGRPASIVADRATGAVALLSVEGLARPGIVLSANGASAEYQLHLEAFPPAKDIAEGAEPLWLPLAALPDGAGGDEAAVDSVALPFVTGAILDNCGYLVAVSLAGGVQSLATDNPTRIITASDLRGVIDSWQIGIETSTCAAMPNQALSKAAEVVVNTETGPDAESPGPAIAHEDAVPVEEGSAPNDEAQTAVDETGAGAPDQGAAEPAPAQPQPENSRENQLMSWLLVIGFIIIGVLLIRRIRPREKSPDGADQAGDAEHSQAASDEPDTLQLQANTDISAPLPRSGQTDEQKMPDINNLGDGNNALVMLEGWLAPDTRFKRYCAVDSEKTHIIIGRGDTDISIEHPAVSRRHASLQSLNGCLAISDLGSSNGTFIRGVPCLPGEVMFIEQGDEIFLGDVGFQVRLISSEADLP